MNKGIVVVISGPSGSGKGTVVELLKKNPKIFLSVSATTRAPREREEDGKQYHFLSEDEFLKRLENGGMLEHNLYCGNYYGTPLLEINEQLEQGKDVLLEIDVNGARQVKEKLPAVTVFLLPPSLQELRNRLCGRGTESDEMIDCRLKQATSELQHIGDYDYTVVNDDVSSAASRIEAIIQAEKCKTEMNRELWGEMIK